MNQPEIKRRKAGKGGVVTMLKSAIVEGQSVIVAKIDERTQIVSVEPMERVREIAENILKPKVGRHARLVDRLRGLPREGQLKRHRIKGTESEIRTTTEEAARFMEPSAARRRLSATSSKTR